MTNRAFPGIALTFAIAIAFMLFGYHLLKKGNTFWAIVLISLGVASIGGITVTTTNL